MSKIKKSLYLSLLVLFIGTYSWSAPTVTMTIPNSFSPNTVISSSSVNANFNEVSSKFNTHTHTDITQLGTVVVGSWNGSIIGTQYGGTGKDFSAITSGSIPYFTSAGAMGTLSADSGTPGNFLQTLGSGSGITYNTVNLSRLSNVTGNIMMSAFNSGIGETDRTFWKGDGTWKNLQVNDFNNGSNASSTTYWRGDGTWASSDLVLKSTTTVTAATNSSDITVSNTKTYLVVYKFQEGASNGSLDLRFNNDTGANYTYFRDGRELGATVAVGAATTGATSLPIATQVGSNDIISGQFKIIPDQGSANAQESMGDAYFRDNSSVNGFMRHYVRWSNGPMTSFRLLSSQVMTGKVWVYELSQ